MKARLRYQQRTAKEEPFGSSTPSAKKLVKASTPEELRSRRGGAAPGHIGHGRKSVTEIEADEVKILDAPQACPCCGGELEEWGWRERTIHDCEPVKRKTRLVRVREGYCRKCSRVHRMKPDGVLTRSAYSNRLLSQVAVWHYRDGLTMGHIGRQFNVPEGSMFGRMHAFAEIFAVVRDRLIEELREAPVKHADETGWRNDGANGYTHGFFTESLSVFCCRDTRSGAVSREVLGQGDPTKEVLVVDRYAGYNRFGGKIQYCYAHLALNTEDVLKENPGNPECAAFVEEFLPLLNKAMSLRYQPIEDAEFYQKAAKLADDIRKCAAKPARHPSVQHIKNIFREKDERLFHWAIDRNVPAENNRAERELRPLVIARKNSFGSQSERGLKTREIMMSVVNTLAKRTEDVVGALTATLDALVHDPQLDVAQHLLSQTPVPAD